MTVAAHVAASVAAGAGEVLSARSPERGTRSAMSSPVQGSGGGGGGGSGGGYTSADGGGGAAGAGMETPRSKSTVPDLSFGAGAAAALWPGTEQHTHGSPTAQLSPRSVGTDE